MHQSPRHLAPVASVQHVVRAHQQPARSGHRHRSPPAFSPGVGCDCGAPRLPRRVRRASGVQRSRLLIHAGVLPARHDPQRGRRQEIPACRSHRARAANAVRHAGGPAAVGERGAHAGAVARVRQARRPDRSRGRQVARGDRVVDRESLSAARNAVVGGRRLHGHDFGALTSSNTRRGPELPLAHRLP